MSPLLRTVALGILSLAFGACRLVEPGPHGQSLLSPLSTPAENLTLEVFSVATPLGDPRIGQLWSELDEQAITPELRQSLCENGIRIGMAGPSVPSALAALLRITDQIVTEDETSTIPLDDELSPRKLVKQPYPGQRNELKVTSVIEELTLLRRVEGQLIGRDYQQAEGLFDMRVATQVDGRARLELVPELHFGEMKQVITGSAAEGVYFYKPQRSKVVYSDLKVSVPLAAGQMFLMTCENDRPLSLGYQFFVRTSGEKAMQKLWVIRLAQAAADLSFTAEKDERAADSVFGTGQ